MVSPWADLPSMRTCDRSSAMTGGGGGGGGGSGAGGGGGGGGGSDFGNRYCTVAPPLKVLIVHGTDETTFVRPS